MDFCSKNTSSDVKLNKMAPSFPDIILQLRKRLSEPLPGQSAQLKMAPAIRNYTTNKKINQIRLSAVLLLLYYKNKALHIVFIKRPEYDGPHSG